MLALTFWIFAQPESENKHEVQIRAPDGNTSKGPPLCLFHASELSSGQKCVSS